MSSQPCTTSASTPRDMMVCRTNDSKFLKGCFEVLLFCSSSQRKGRLYAECAIQNHSWGWSIIHLRLSACLPVRIFGLIFELRFLSWLFSHLCCKLISVLSICRDQKYSATSSVAKWPSRPYTVSIYGNDPFQHETYCIPGYTWPKSWLIIKPLEQ